jgi:hypothetical protein
LKPQPHRRAVLKGLLLASMPGAVLATASPGTVHAAKLHQGEAALMRGDAEAAMQAFEQAGALGHDPAIELGLVRAAMQAGRYRQALGFAAHTAGEHARDAACLTTYLWLLRLGGQHDFARQLWLPASQLDWQASDQQVLRALQDAWASDWPQATGALRRQPLRLAPYAHGTALPADARVVATGTLVRDAQGLQRVIVPASVLAHGPRQRWWVRNGRGLTLNARLDAVDAEGLLGALQCDEAMPDGASLAPRNAFPGSPAYAFAHAVDELRSDIPATDAEAPQAPAAWPSMTMGFAGQPHPQGGSWLGVDLHARRNPLGGPVLDAQGRLTGVSIGAQGDEPGRLVPASTLLQRGWASTPPEAGQAGPRLASDEMYERGLASTVQIIRAD